MANLDENKVKYSVVVPVYNEQGNVVKLHQEILETMNRLGEPFEMIFIDDGSVDKTLSEMANLQPLTIIIFRKNFGQTAAMDAGIKQAEGEFIITLDADLQNPPAEILRLVKQQRKTKADVVSGWRKYRHDPLSKRLASRAANFMRTLLVKDGIHDSGCSLKIYRRECFKGVDLHGEMHRFIPAILKLKGFEVTEVVVKHRPRIHGQTKYNWKRGIKGNIDMVAIWFWRKYSARPLHLFGSLGLLFITLSIIMAAVAIFRKLAYGADLSDTALTIFAGFCFLFGIQFFISGLLADIAIKNHYATTKTTNYAIRKVIKNERLT